MGLASDIPKRHSQGTLRIPVSHSLSLSSTVPPPLMCMSFIAGIPVATGLHKISCFLYLISVVFCKGLHRLQRDVSLMKGEDCTYV